MFFKGQKIDKYRIEEPLGSGGFGSVYLAIDTMINRPVAIKVPHKQGEELDKLLQEPRLLAALEHPNFVRVITADRCSGVFYIVMEYVDGPSLENYLREQKRLDVMEALHWFLQVCTALSHAHSKRILHRDIRPANILLTKDLSMVKITDLGTSRYLIDAAFASTRIGSPPYMAPEHFRGKANFQSDIYSMGVMMYECLTGTLPFFDANPQRMARLAQEGSCKPPHHYNSQVPLELSQIVLNAMHRHMDRRYATVSALHEDLYRVWRNLTANSQELEEKEKLPPPPTNQERREPEGEVPPTQQIFTANIRYRDTPSKNSRLFCWNCNKPISKRAQVCPHCNVAQN